LEIMSLEAYSHEKVKPAGRFMLARLLYDAARLLRGNALMLNFHGKYRQTAAASLVAVAAFLTACQSSDNSIAGVDATAPPPPQEKITQSELLAFCPSISVREGTAAFRTYAGGGNGDATKVVYQASIGDSTRACRRADGQMAIDVAVAGRVVPGPMGQAGSITMPIRVVVTSGGSVVFSELYQHNVAISETKSATQFLFKAPAVMIPTPADGQARIYVGFDEGPDQEPVDG
jgi:hypothetical protein